MSPKIRDLDIVQEKILVHFDPSCVGLFPLGELYRFAEERNLLLRIPPEDETSPD